MAGFPARISRLALGEDMDPTEEINPRTDIGGARFNLDWWQLAGMNLTASRARVVVAADGSRVAAAEAWNPNQDGSLHPTVVRNGVGDYTVTFASSALDETGASVAIGLGSARASAQSTTLGDTAVAKVQSNGHVVDVKTGSGTTPADLPFELECW